MSFKTILLIFLLTCFLAGCHDGQSADVNEPNLLIFTDVSRLRERIYLPEEVISATWTVQVVGSASGLGPTDTRLYALIRLDGDSFSELSMENDQQQLETVIWPKNVAEALLPSEWLGDLSVDGSYSVTGIGYAPQSFDKGNYFGLHAIRIEDALLLGLQTR